MSVGTPAVATPSVAVPAVGIASVKAKGALKPMTAKQIQQQATKTVQSAYQPTINDLQSQINNAEGLAAKRTSDNEYYQDWLTSQSNALESQQASQNATITNALTAISQSASNLGSNGSAAMAAQANQRSGNTANITGSGTVAAAGNTGQSYVDTASALGVADQGISSGLVNAGSLNDAATIQNAESTNQSTLQKSLQALDSSLATAGTDEGNAVTTQENQLTSNAQQVAENNQSNRLSLAESNRTYKTGLAENNRSAAVSAYNSQQTHNLDEQELGEKKREYNKSTSIAEKTLDNTIADDTASRNATKANTKATGVKTQAYVQDIIDEIKSRDANTLIARTHANAALVTAKSEAKSRNDTNTDNVRKTAAYLKSLSDEDLNRDVSTYGKYGINITGGPIGIDKKTQTPILSQASQNSWHQAISKASSGYSAIIKNGYLETGQKDAKGNAVTEPLAKLSYNQLRKLYTTGFTYATPTGSGAAETHQVGAIDPSDPVGWTAFNIATGQGVTPWDSTTLLKTYGINANGLGKPKTATKSAPKTTKPAATKKK